MKLNSKIFISNHKLAARLYSRAQYIRMLMGKKKGLHELMQKSIDTFVTDPEKRVDVGYIKKLKKDLLYCYYRYLIIFDEYFYYQFEKLNDNGRSEYVGKKQQQLLFNKLDQDGIYQIFKDKEKTYQVYKPYFGREMIRVESESDWSAFETFVGKYSRFVLKPIDSHWGLGFRIIEKDNTTDIKDLFSEIIQRGGSVRRVYCSGS